MAAAAAAAAVAGSVAAAGRQEFHGQQGMKQTGVILQGPLRCGFCATHALTGDSSVSSVSRLGGMDESGEWQVLAV